MVIEPIILILAIIAVIIVYLLLKSVTHIIINTIMGLIILALSNYIFHIGINLKNIWVLLVCAIGGIPGALLVILLHILHIAF